MTEIIKFGAEWCKPCKKQDEILEDIEKEWNDVVINRIDVEQSNKELKQEYTITSLPTIIVTQDDTVQAQFSGLTAAEDINRAIRNAKSRT